MRLTAFIVMTLLCAMPAFAKIDLEKSLYNAFISNDYRQWAKVVSLYEQEANLNSTEERINLIHCYYGYTSVLIDKKQTTEAKKSIAKAEKLIEEGLHQSPKNALLLDYQGTFISYKITMNKLRGLSLGKKAIALIDQAYALAPNSVQILFDKGNALYYPPKLFGGDKQAALSYFQKAIKIVEQSGKTQNNWVYLQMLFISAHCHELLGNNAEATTAYKKALSKEPNFKTAKIYYQKFLQKTEK